MMTYRRRGCDHDEHLQTYGVYDALVVVVFPFLCQPKGQIECVTDHYGTGNIESKNSGKAGFTGYVVVHGEQIGHPCKNQLQPRDPERQVDLGISLRQFHENINQAYQQDCADRDGKTYISEFDHEFSRAN